MTITKVLDNKLLNGIHDFKLVNTDGLQVSNVDYDSTIVESIQLQIVAIISVK